MYSEIQNAVGFLSSFLFNKLPRRKINLFAEQLANYLLLKYQNHWYPEEPQKGSAFRCIRVCQSGISDALIAVAAQTVGVDYEDILQNLPQDLTIWVDPGEISYRAGERDSVHILYSSDPEKALLQQLQSLTMAENQQSATRPGSLEGLNRSASPSPYSSDSPSPTSFSRGSQSCSPTSANGSGTFSATSIAPTLDVQLGPIFQIETPNEMKFTVGTFAQTRFGTTKLKRRELNGCEPTMPHPYGFYPDPMSGYESNGYCLPQGNNSSFYPTSLGPHSYHFYHQGDKLSQPQQQQQSQLNGSFALRQIVVPGELSLFERSIWD